jgi:hypothetical protein
MLNFYLGGITMEIGIPSEDDEFELGRKIVPGWKIGIASLFSSDESLSKYVYDFGDNWIHIVKLEKISPKEKNTKYPICIAGRRACPPEDCGGIWGYEGLLKIIKNKKHKEHKTMLKWLGGEFNPESFNPKNVKFDDPRKRLRNL